MSYQYRDDPLPGPNYTLYNGGDYDVPDDWIDHPEEEDPEVIAHEDEYWDEYWKEAYEEHMQEERESSKVMMLPVIRYGLKSLYHPESGTFVITDLCDGANRESEEHGMRAGNGDWLFGVMTCTIPKEKASILRDEYGSLEEYALACIPAPGTIADDRMSFYPIDEDADINDIVDMLLQDRPYGWQIE